MGAIAMEVSNPFLSLHVLFRQLDGVWAARVSGVAAGAFAITFFLVRILFYGWQVASFHYSFWLRSELLPPEVPVPLSYAILVIFTAGLVLQLLWLRLVISKVLRVLLGRGKKDDNGLEDEQRPSKKLSTLPRLPSLLRQPSQTTKRRPVHQAESCSCTEGQEHRILG